MSKNYVNINLSFMNTNLSIQEATVLSYIESLAKQKGYCFASNEFISRNLGLNERTLYRIFNKLEGRKYITRITKSIGNNGKQRKIYISPDVKLVSCM